MDEPTTPAPLPSSPAPPPALGLQAFGVSECGPYRPGNEDAFTVDLERGLFVVADGMGGHAAGEIASRLAVESIQAFIARSEGDTDLTWPFGLDSSLSTDANRLRTALHLANQRVFRAAASDPAYAGMGTTVVAVLFTPSAIVVGHAGDSRVYEERDGQLVALTADDSLLNALGELQLSPEAHAQHPLRNVVTNVLGGDEQILAHMSERPRAPGRRVVLCSDGVHGTLDDGRIGGILAAESDPRRVAERLVADAIAAGGRDNATALVVVDGETA
ncbi:MAG: protein phosphatase 2C domain-containing protein [Acidobacteriota bacterium]